MSVGHAESFVASNPRTEDATVALKAMASSDEEIYQEHILDHYEDPYHRGNIDYPTHHHQDDNPLCGDVIRVDLKIDDEGKVLEAFFDGERTARDGFRFPPPSCCRKTDKQLRACFVHRTP